MYIYIYIGDDAMRTQPLSSSSLQGQDQSI